MTQTAVELRITDIPATTFAFVVRRVAQHEIGEFVGGALTRVGEFAAARGGTYGPAMTICSPPDDEGYLVVEAGWPVRAGTAPEAPVEVRRIPSTRAALHVHTGGPDELDASFYAEFARALRAQGATPVGAPRERYLATGVTEIVWPVG